MEGLRDQVAVVTGGTRGLGYAIARAFVEEGGKVVVASRSESSVKRAVMELCSSGGQVCGMPCDVRVAQQVHALADFAIRQYGHFDIWVNNAGLSSPTGPTFDIETERSLSVLETNILGTFHGSHAAMKHFVPRQKGKLINFLGMGENKPTPHHNPYSSSKAWIRYFTTTLAKEYRDSGIGVFLYNPGLVDSEMISFLEFVEGYEQDIRIFKVVSRIFKKSPEVAAQKVAWLASAATDGKTGTYLNLISPGNMLKDVFKYGVRVISGHQEPPAEVTVSLLKPVLGSPVNLNHQMVFDLADKNLPGTVGNKAKNLRLMQDRQLRIPKTWACTWEAYQAYIRNGSAVLDQIKTQLERVIDPERAYAVRSSANLEDDKKYSFAGQFTSILDVKGVDAVLQAMTQIWDSTRSESVQAYLQKSNDCLEDLKMGVVIQEMVTPVLSGVAFSKNPITGLNEILIEAVQGYGSLLVQEGETPLRWIKKWDHWIKKEDEEVVSLELIQQIADQTQKISGLLNRDVDLEWVYDGENLYWVQMRDITAIHEINVYSSKMAKEMTPGLIKPLVWSVVVPIASQKWVMLFSEVTGRFDYDSERLMKAFHYRAYHNIGVMGSIFESLGLPRSSMEVMLGVIPVEREAMRFKPSFKLLALTPRLIRFFFSKVNFMTKAKKDYPRLFKETYAFPLENLDSFSDVELLRKIDHNKELNKEITYNSVVIILSMSGYNGMLGTQLKRHGHDLECFDLTGGFEEIKRFDPSHDLEALHKQFAALDESQRAQILNADYASFQRLPGLEAFQKEMAEFLNRYGHLSDSTGHFGDAPWRETPELILKMVAGYQLPVGERAAKASLYDLKLRGPGGWVFKKIRDRAIQFRLYREMYSSLLSYSYMVFRAYYFAIGEHLVQKGLLTTKEDILYLYDEEVRRYILYGQQEAPFAALVTQRQAEIEESRDAVLPQIIYGDVLPPIIKASSDQLSGIPTSKGYYCGVIKVIKSVSDFHKLEPGDVLVIPHSDVSWTPLFAVAGAVISESGGVLSHSSIVAREYGIPAVVSVPGATHLQDFTRVSVDGYKGVVVVHTLD